MVRDSLSSASQDSPGDDAASSHNATMFSPPRDRHTAVREQQDQDQDRSNLLLADSLDRENRVFRNVSNYGSTEPMPSSAGKRLHEFLPMVEGAMVSPFQVPSEFLSGWGAAFVNITITFPINKLIFRQQLHGINGVKALRQLRKEGLQNLYRGLLPPLLQKTTSLSIMFGAYHKFQLGLDRAFPAAPRPLTHATAAMIAGTLEMMLSPFERIQTLLQDKKYQGRFHNTFHAARELRAFGPREFYRGGTVILLRNGPSNVLFFLGREYLDQNLLRLLPSLKNLDLEGENSSRFLKDFLCGACLGALISTGFFPLNVVKTRMQSKLGGPFRGLTFTFREVWVERGRSWGALFRGFHLNYTRSFLSWGVINATYEGLMRFFRRRHDNNSNRGSAARS